MNSKLQELAARLVHDGTATAVAIAAAVRKGDKWTRVIAVAGRLGSAALAPQTRESTLFDLASVTKPVTALTVARLVRTGRFAFSHTLGELLPEVGGTPAADATLELLLAHRAGLLAHLPLYEPLCSGQSFDRGRALLAAAARRVDCRGPVPAEGFAPVYSDLGYLLIGEAIARSTGRSLDDLVHEEVIAPLDLEAGLGSAQRLKARLPDFCLQTAATEVVNWRAGVVCGAVHDENAWAMSGHALSGHAGLFGDCRAVLTLGEALLAVMDGRMDDFLTQAEFNPLVRIRPGGTLRAGFDGKSDTNSSIGDHWSARSFGHLGFTGTSLWVDPDRQLAGVLLTNRVHPTRTSQRIRRARPVVYDALAEWADGVRG